MNWSDYWQLQQGDKYGGYNCSAYVLAAGLKLFGITTTGARVRALSDEPIPNWDSPGLRHEQLHDVAAKYGVHLDVRYGLAWEEVLEVRAAGHPICLGLNYNPIRTTIYTGQPTFTGNHEFLLASKSLDFDPLADGRRIGIFRGPANYPDELLKRAAGELILSTEGGTRRLGYGKAYVAIFPRLSIPPAPDSSVVINGPETSERNVMITTTVASYRFKLTKGQPLYRHPGGPVVAKMSFSGNVEWTGNAGPGWTAVQVNTKAPYADGITRPTIVYVPTKAGVRV